MGKGGFSWERRVTFKSVGNEPGGETPNVWGEHSRAKGEKITSWGKWKDTWEKKKGGRDPGEFRERVGQSQGEGTGTGTRTSYVGGPRRGSREFNGRSESFQEVHGGMVGTRDTVLDFSEREEGLWGGV